VAQTLSVQRRVVILLVVSLGGWTSGCASRRMITDLGIEAGAGHSAAAGGAGGISGLGSPAAGGDGPSGGAGGSSSSSGLAGMGGGTGVHVPTPLYKIVVNAPLDHSTVSGIVTVDGWARGLLNVEIWDATHGNTTPPLGRATPTDDGWFTMQVDTRALESKSTTWTVWGWVTPAGTPGINADPVELTLTVANSTGAGGSSGATVGTRARNYLLGFYTDKKTDGPYHTWLGYYPEVDYDASYQDHAPGGGIYPPSVKYPNVLDVDICNAKLDYGEVADHVADDSVTKTRDSIPSDWYPFIYAIRIDSEFNLIESCLNVDAATYKKAAERVITLYKAKLPARVKYIWNPNVGHGSDLDARVPANCDAIGIDAYAQPQYNAPSQALFGDKNSPAVGSLWWWTKVARAQGKALALPEWGDDYADGVYIQAVAAWADDPANNVVYLGYWDSPDKEDASLRGASLAAFTKAFANRPYGGTLFAPLITSSQYPAGF